ncbi:MAG: MaoC family dehydratase N-terminal domain-containing protein [Proteobacteria bacterium]|nr:MaoC family dehydratase N-terminal domain-containing protein [Pseudomonadota bacterium]
MAEEVHIEDFIKTEKQKAFDHDFFKGAESYEKWEDVDMDAMYDGRKTFEVKVEDIRAFSEGILDDNPLFNDEAAAKDGPFGGLIAHPIFITPIAFWLTEEGPGNWIRTPGAINPGQIIEYYEQIRPGDVIHGKTGFYDKWLKRGKRYLTYVTEYYRQDDVMVAKGWGTLILPTSTGEDTHKF